MRVRLQRAASFLIATWLSSLVSPTHAAEQPPDTMEARLLACVVCHGEHGEGTSNDYFPRLAGKPAGYLYNQLVAFHEGRRRCDGGALCHRAANSTPANAASGERRGAGARPPVSDQWRFGAWHPALLSLPRSVADRYGTRHTRPRGTARQVCHRATGSVALRHSNGDRAGLHANRRWALDRGRRHRCGCLPLVAFGSRRSLTAQARRPGDAARLRQ